MQLRNLTRSMTGRAGVAVAASLLTASLAFAGESERGVLVLTSTNDPSTNQVLVYQLETGDSPALSLVQTLPTGGRGGAGGNAGIVQMKGDFGAVANYGSSSVSELVREGDFVQVRGQINLAAGCVKPDSVALSRDQLFVSIFFSDGKGGEFYKSVPLPGAPTDITVSKDRKWLAVIYSANGSGYIAVFAIDAYGDLAPEATSSPVGIPGFSGVAISE